jgi:hypothetical protein
MVSLSKLNGFVEKTKWFRKKTAHNEVVTNLDKFCDRIFNGFGKFVGISWELFGNCLGISWYFLFLIIN